MIDLALDKDTHDVYIASNDLQLVNTVDQIEQNLKIRLSFFRSEWFLDIKKGIPYYTEVLIKNPNIPNIENILKAVIADTIGVEEILYFSSDYNTSARSYTVEFKVRTLYGEAGLSVSLF